MIRERVTRSGIELERIAEEVESHNAQKDPHFSPEFVYHAIQSVVMEDKDRPELYVLYHNKIGSTLVAGDVETLHHVAGKDGNERLFPDLLARLRKGHLLMLPYESDYDPSTQSLRVLVDIVTARVASRVQEGAFGNPHGFEYDMWHRIVGALPATERPGMTRRYDEIVGPLGYRHNSELIVQYAAEKPL